MICVRLQDHPEHGVLYLVRGLLNMVQDYTWEDNSDAKVRVYTSALPLLAAMSQETYLYSIPKSNFSQLFILHIRSHRAAFCRMSFLFKVCACLLFSIA